MSLVAEVTRLPRDARETLHTIGNMAHIVSPLDQPSNYKDSQTRVDRQRQNELLAKSTTLYVGVFITTLPNIHCSRKDW